jgi:uncharacterized OB-fold protein
LRTFFSTELMGASMAKQIPLVDYLVLGDDPHLVAHECTSCGARFFDRRNACASCGNTAFPVPYVAAVVDCEGTSVRGNLINVTPDAEHVSTGMKVRLATEVIGTDDEGTEAVGFGFEPLGG